MRNIKELNALEDHSLFEIPPFDGPYLGGVFHFDERDGALCGLLLDDQDTPVENVPACLYRLTADGGLKPEACTFSDAGGRFLLGPIRGGETYYLKVQGCSEGRFYHPQNGEIERDSPASYRKYRDIYKESK